ncbi:putative bifunctional diguanylate cyclase/phosphodiesterase [Noviherbaspirillum soli]|uniref:putative bifunctional diguanylate cyclase/phosphodiesterase n=1 Tax=Noviherbaspirillum soli TaxID=1064518 RepID=UPI00188A0BBA|nr:EAL domain-containing protein [Noviherbaspirillum soli]
MNQRPFPENSRAHASQAQPSTIGNPSAAREFKAQQTPANAGEQADGPLLQAAQRLRESRQQLHDLIALAPSPYLLASRDGVLLEANPALCAMSGHAPADLTGRNLAWLLPDGPRTPGDDDAMLPGIRSLRHRDGHAIPVRLHASVSRDASGAPDRLHCFLSQAGDGLPENRSQELALHDALTGLPDRTLLNQRLQHLLEQADGKPVALMFLDLDQFRKVNEMLGHEAGDQLLRQVALRLRAMLPADGIVARLGGDEFVVAARCPAGASDAAATAGRLLAALAAPFSMGGEEAGISASIGVAMHPADAATRETLFRHADAALHRAKAAGRNSWCFFEAEVNARARARMLMEQALHRALERGEFELHYQPRLDLRSMAVTGMEALLRWNHPHLGRIAPQDFIPVAQQLDLMDDIGHWALRQACLQGGRLQRQFGRALRVSVNLSARQLCHPALGERLGAALEAAGLAPQLLELELAETALTDDLDAAARRLGALKAHGVRIAVDHFGAGGGALACIQHLPVDTVKLDPTQDSARPGFLKALVTLAHALDIRVTATGIETLPLRDRMRDAGCDDGQGYLLAGPLSLAEFQLFLARLPA